MTTMGTTDDKEFDENDEQNAKKGEADQKAPAESPGTPWPADWSVDSRSRTDLYFVFIWGFLSMRMQTQLMVPAVDIYILHPR